MKSFRLSLAIAFVSAVVVTTACTKKSASQASAPLTPEQLLERGQKMFLMNCTSCHGADPLKDGPVGPAIAGSSRELIEARVMRAQYPPGYFPKRSTALMVALPNLEREIPAIYAYLNSVK